MISNLAAKLQKKTDTRPHYLIKKQINRTAPAPGGFHNFSPAIPVIYKKCRIFARITLHILYPTTYTMRVKIHHEGTNILTITLLVLLSINIALWLTVSDIIAVPITVTAITAILYLLLVNFFRSPRRIFTGDRDNAVVASADGRVVALEEVYEPEYLKCRCIQLSVFMSVLNVHANWFPVDGKVIHTAHQSGRFMAAYLPKSSTENERSTIVIETPHGQTILMRQIAGAMARRIVTYARPGEEASIDYHAGFIKFGSRVDLFLPLGTDICVAIGDTTVGGVTCVGRLKPSDTNGI